MLVLSFDSVHKFLEENLFLLALGHENVPNYICKLLVVVELSEKDVLLRLIFALFKSHWVESIDKETFYRKDQEFTQMLVANYLLKNISIAAVLGLLKNVFKRALGKVPLFLLRVRSLRIFNLLKEFIRLRYTKDLSEAGTEAARTFVVNTIDNFFENSCFYLLFLWGLVLVTGFLRGAKQHGLDFLQGHLGFETEKPFTNQYFLHLGSFIFKRVWIVKFPEI